MVKGDFEFALIQHLVVTAADQGGLVMLAEVVPGYGHPVGLLCDIQQSIVVLHASTQIDRFQVVKACPIVKRAMVNPYMGGTA